MERHKGLDRDTVLDTAVAVFWQQGYGGTSIKDLVNALGVHRVEQKLSELVRAGQAGGQFRQDQPPADLVRMVRATMSGMIFAACLQPNPAVLRPIREGLLRALA